MKQQVEMECRWQMIQMQSLFPETDGIHSPVIFPESFLKQYAMKANSQPEQCRRNHARYFFKREQFALQEVFSLQRGEKLMYANIQKKEIFICRISFYKLWSAGGCTLRAKRKVDGYTGSQRYMNSQFNGILGEGVSINIKIPLIQN